MKQIDIGNVILEFPDNATNEDMEKAIADFRNNNPDTNFSTYQDPAYQDTSFGEYEGDSFSDKIAFGAKTLPYLTFLAPPPISAAVTGVSRFAEGLAEGESLKQAAIQGGKAGATDLVFGKIGKIKKLKNLIKPKPKKAPSNEIAYSSPKEILEKKQYVMQGKDRLNLSEIKDPAFIDVVQANADVQLTKLMDKSRKLQKNSIDEGSLKYTDEAEELYKKLLKEAKIKPLNKKLVVNDKQAYKVAYENIPKNLQAITKQHSFMPGKKVTLQPKSDLKNLYVNRIDADESINWNTSKKNQEPFLKIRRFYDSVLRHPKLNTKAAEYSKHTDDLAMFLGDDFSRAKLKNLPYFQQEKFIQNLKRLSPSLDNKERTALNKLILEIDKMEVVTAFKQLDPSLLEEIASKVPLVGNLLRRKVTKGRAKSNTNTTRRLFGHPSMKANPFTNALQKTIVGSEFLTPIEKEQFKQEE